MNTNEENLQLRFDPRTIEHLGIKMYSQLPYALAELVANAYDAGASNAIINLYDKDPAKKVLSLLMMEMECPMKKLETIF